MLLKKTFFKRPNPHLKISRAPFRGEIFFSQNRELWVSKFASWKMWLRKTIRFEKEWLCQDLWTKNWLKMVEWPQTLFFNSFFGYNSGYSRSFSKLIFLLSHIFQDANFDTHKTIFWEKKFHPLKGTLRIFRGGVSRFFSLA